jgi:hypothetical protein
MDNPGTRTGWSPSSSDPATAGSIAPAIALGRVHKFMMKCDGIGPIRILKLMNFEI